MGLRITTIVDGNMTGRVTSQEVLSDIKLHHFLGIYWEWPFDCTADNPVVNHAMKAFSDGEVSRSRRRAAMFTELVSQSRANGPPNIYPK